MSLDRTVGQTSREVNRRELCGPIQVVRSETIRTGAPSGLGRHSACTAPVAYAVAGAAPALAAFRQNAGGSSVDYYPVLAAYDGGAQTLYDLASSGACNPLTLDPATFVLYTVGVKIPVEEFAAVTTLRPS
jgi:hypothetical protein